MHGVMHSEALQIYCRSSFKLILVTYRPVSNRFQSSFHQMVALWDNISPLIMLWTPGVCVTHGWGSVLQALLLGNLKGT